MPLRRKIGVSYTSPGRILDSDSIVSDTPKSDGDVVKRRRFSGSFRERTRNFRIQMRRRSGTWFTAAAEKSSDLDLTSNSSSATNIPSISVSEETSQDDSSLSTPNRNSKSRSSFVSIFGKRKSKHYSDDSSEPVTRRRSECNRKIDPDELLDKQLSTSISAPIITYPGKESKESTVAEVISEEPLENVNEINEVSTTEIDVKNGKSSCADELVVNGSSMLQEDVETTTTEKKHKKGKIMKTLRNIIGKGKN